MRHITALLIAVIVAPLAWICLALAQGHGARTVDVGVAAVADTESGVRALLLLVAAGVLLGLLATLRWSPLGALATGTTYLAVQAVLVIAPGNVPSLFTDTVAVAGHRADLGAPARTGTAAVLAAMLTVATIGLAWSRRRPRPTASPVFSGVAPYARAETDRRDSEAVRNKADAGRMSLTARHSSTPVQPVPSWVDSLRRRDPTDLE